MRYRMIVLALLTLSCTKVSPEKEVPPQSPIVYTPRQMAGLLSAAAPQMAHALEVHHAASASLANGYDEEYLLKDAYCHPGAGIGDPADTKSSFEESAALRELLKGAGADSTMIGEDLQIYWPFSESWDGTTLPVITYDPGDYGTTNEGWLPNGEKVMVDEQMAMERPVWVVSTNSDAPYTSLEMLRRQDPAWGQGGGEIIVKGDTPQMSTLIMRSFKAKRQFDSWFAGGSEFFVKTGAIEDFTASTEAELRLYQPSVTDFMIVVKRSQVNMELPFNAVLVSEWSGQLDNCAFMISEDDGGTRTSWKCTALVRYNSKSYGFEVDLPVNSRDDIVWRGALTRNFIQKYSGKVLSLGDVDIVLELI